MPFRALIRRLSQTFGIHVKLSRGRFTPHFRGWGLSRLSSAPSHNPLPTEPSSSSQHASTMSQAMSSPSDLQLLFNDALQAYEKQTNIYLFAHPLAAQFQSCDSPSATLALLRKQVRGGDDRWTRWLDPTVNVLDALSMILGERVNLVCLETSTLRNLYLISTPQVISPAKLIFTGIGVLLLVRTFLIPSCGSIVTLTSLRRLRMPGQTKTLLLNSSSALDFFPDASRPTSGCHRPRT